MSAINELIDITYRRNDKVHPVPGAKYVENGQVVVYPAFRIKRLKTLFDMGNATLSNRLHAVKRSPGWCYFAFKRWYREVANDAERRHCERALGFNSFWLTGIPD